MALGGRQAQLNNLMHRFLGVPLNDTDDPNNIFRILRTHIGASSPRDILRLSREDLDNFTLTDAIGNNTKLTFVQKLRILDLGRWASSHDTAVDWASADPDDFEEWVDKTIIHQGSEICHVPRITPEIGILNPILECRIPNTHSASPIGIANRHAPRLLLRNKRYSVGYY